MSAKNTIAKIASVGLRTKSETHKVSTDFAVGPEPDILGH